MPHSQPTALQQTVCKFHLDPQYHIFHWGSTILGDSTLWWTARGRLRKCNQLAMHKNRRWIVQAWRFMALHMLHIEPLIISCLPIRLILTYQYVTLCSMVFCSFSASHNSIMPLIPSELLTFVLGIHWSVVKHKEPVMRRCFHGVSLNKQKNKDRCYLAAIFDLWGVVIHDWL